MGALLAGSAQMRASSARLCCDVDWQQATIIATKRDAHIVLMELFLQADSRQRVARKPCQYRDFMRPELCKIGIYAAAPSAERVGLRCLAARNGQSGRGSASID